MLRMTNPESSTITTSPSFFSSNSLLWNEEELRLNEQIKAELSTEKIDEPRTPYIRDFSPEKATNNETLGDREHSCKGYV